MFTAGRYIIVDDKLEEMRPLVDALHAIGAPCLGVHFDPERETERSIFAGVRILFLDINLIPGQSTSEGGRYSPLVTLLERSIHEQGGPYIIILWTSHAEEEASVTLYLERALEKPFQRPLAVFALDKDKYRSGNTAWNASLLRADVEEKLALTPQLRALLSWEGDVLGAASAVLTELVQLIPPADRNSAAYAGKLDEVLSQLAVAAVGKHNVTRDIRGAVNGALAPILQDRIMNVVAPDGGSEALWSSAVTRHAALPDLDEEASGRMNRMLHLACPPAEICDPVDWGAVVVLPDAERTKEAMTTRFGEKLDTILNQVFFLESASRPSCTPCLVRIGAVCDYAQRKKGPIPYVLGVIIPNSVNRRVGPYPASEFACPVMVMPPSEAAATLHVNARFQITLTEAQVTGWQTLCRIREQLLMSMIGHVSGYVSRPGILRLPN